MVQSYDFASEINVIKQRKKALSKVLTFVYNWFGRVGLWVFGPILLDAIIISVGMYFIMNPDKLLLMHFLILFGAVALLVGCIAIITRFVFRRSKGVAGVIYSLQHIIDNLVLERGELAYAFKKFASKQSNTEKLYALNYAILTVDSSIQEVERSMEKFLSLSSTASVDMKTIYQSEYQHLSDLSDRLTDYYNALVDEKNALKKKT